MTKRDLIAAIIGRCMDQQEAGNDAMVSFSGHVDRLSVRIFDGAWEDKKEPEINFDQYVDGEWANGVETKLQFLLTAVSRLPFTENSAKNLDGKRRKDY